MAKDKWIRENRKIISRKNTRLETSYDENFFSVELEIDSDLCNIDLKETEARKLHKYLTEYLEYRKYLLENL